MGLTGEQLLEYLKGVPEGTPPDEIMKGAGYSFVRRNGTVPQEVMLRTAFFQAVAAAKGEELACLAPLKGSSLLNVSSTNRVTIQAPHLRFLGAEAGDKVLVKQCTSGNTDYLTITKAS